MFTLPPLEYNYDALGKYISKDIMELHHSKHHQIYVDKLNAALQDYPELQQQSLPSLLSHLSDIPESVRGAVQNVGGGHYNHTLFWKFMNPSGGGEPTGELATALQERYGSFQAFIDEFEKVSLAIFGSGWAWLQPDLSIVNTANQDSPLNEGKPAPILGLDVWEHAYYLDYTYNRADYVKAWWHVVDWEYVAERYRGTQDEATLAL